MSAEYESGHSIRVYIKDHDQLIHILTKLERIGICWYNGAPALSFIPRYIEALEIYYSEALKKPEDCVLKYYYFRDKDTPSWRNVLTEEIFIITAIKMYKRIKSNEKTYDNNAYK
jgi:hypothetical protein